MAECVLVNVFFFFYQYAYACRGSHIVTETRCLKIVLPLARGSIYFPISGSDSRQPPLLSSELYNF